MKAFYTGLREVYGLTKRGTTQLTSTDGKTVLQEKSDILDRFADHFDHLLNIPGNVEPTTLSAIKQRPEIRSLTEPVGMKELTDAINATQDGKAPERCGIPAEIWKHGGLELMLRLHKLILQIWNHEEVLQDWKDESIVPIFK